MYYLGQSAIPVKPITRRTTWTRGMQSVIRKAYLQRPGRCPVNRRAYPVQSVPISTAAINRQGRTLGYVLTTDMSLEPGQQMGQSILTPLTPFKTTYTPSIPSVVAAPAPTSSFWNPVASLVNLWNERPQVLKDIRLRVNPNTVMQAAQKVVKPGQVQGFVDQASKWGVNLDYRGMPISGPTAGFSYRLAGIDWAGWMPWIIGGGAVLFVLPMLTKKR